MELGLREALTTDPVATLCGLVDALGEVSGGDLDDPVRLDTIAVLERVKGAAAAAQARVTAAFADSRAAGAGGSRSTGSMVALARRESPARGDRFVGLAKALVTEMPHTQVAMARGDVSEWAATLVCQATATLTREDRAETDVRLRDVFGTCGTRALAGAAARIAAELDAASVVARMEQAARSRRVSIRPAPDGMARLSILGPLVEVVGAYAALRRDAEVAQSGHGVQGGPVDAGDAARARSHGQLMTDLALERLGGPHPGTRNPSRCSW